MSRCLKGNTPQDRTTRLHSHGGQRNAATQSPTGSPNRLLRQKPTQKKHQAPPTDVPVGC
eukprot:5313603-Amphidinium_carterae.1